MDFKTFKSQGSITIQQVITAIKYNVEAQLFSIGFCRATSNAKSEPKGAIVWIDKAVYATSGSFQKENRTKNKDDGSVRNFKSEGTLPIKNYETQEFKTPLIASIMFFNGKLVKHQGNEE